MFLLSKAKTAGYIASCLLILSCSKHQKQNLTIKKPNEITLTKGDSTTVALILKNETSREILIDKVSTSCQCINVSKNKFKLKKGNVDTLKLNLHGTIMGKNKELIVLTNDRELSFQKIYLDYEVTD